MSKRSQEQGESAARPCKVCGTMLVFAVDDQGKTHPLDLAPPTYVIIEDVKTKGKFRAIRSSAYVSHFATCKAAPQS